MRKAALILSVIGGLCISAAMIFAFSLAWDYVRLADGHHLWAAARLTVAVLLALAGIGGGLLVRSRPAVGGIIMLVSVSGAWVVCLIGTGTLAEEGIIAGVGLIYGSPFLIAGGILGLILASKLRKSARIDKN